MIYRPIITLKSRDPPIRIELTIMVMIPIGPTASKTLSCHPIETERNCFVVCSPKRVIIGPTAVPIVLMKSDQSLAGGAVGADKGPAAVVVVAILESMLPFDKSSFS